MRTPRVALLAALCLMPSLGQAATITYSFEGTIGVIDPGLVVPFSVGDPLSGSFQIESTTPDGGGASDFGFYPGVANISADFGGYTGSAAGGTSNEALLILDRAAGAGLDEVEMTIQPFAGAPLGSFMLIRVQIDLEDHDGTAFSSDALPLALDLADFEAGAALLLFTDGETFLAASGPLSSFSVSVPEPGTLGLFALGALASAARRRRE